MILHFLHSTDGSCATDAKCEIHSSCSLSECQYTNPMTVDPGSNITLNCSSITGGLVQGMTWNQILERVKTSTGLSNLVLEQSTPTTSSGKFSCQCTDIKFTRKCFLRLFLLLQTQIRICLFTSEVDFIMFNQTSNCVPYE